MNASRAWISSRPSPRSSSHPRPIRPSERARHANTGHAAERADEEPRQPPGRLRPDAHRAADALGLDEAADKIVADYSAGMTQKIGLACALIHAPRVWARGSSSRR